MVKDYWKGIDIWGGIECSFNRVEDNYMDQLQLAGHYHRNDDIERIAELGIKALRYPVLWEKHQPTEGGTIDWRFAEKQLHKIQQAGIEPIVGLVHHGSGPRYASFYDQTFEKGLATYAAEVAAQFPWVTHYTPVNEPLTTARFCGLYGIWFPHGTNDTTFLKVLLAECKGTVLAMQAIRKINPAAKLVQTEDLGKTHSTPLLKYQADFENHRRWLSFDLLCGKVNPQHPLWNYLMKAGITAKELDFFIENPCPPDVMGINHYITSERFLDERLEHYPQHTHGGNGKHQYADVEAVRLKEECLAGPKQLLLETWQRYQLPIAVTEVHLHCTREEQLRWFNYVYSAAGDAKQDGADIRAVTAWAVLGSFDWCSLLTKPSGVYEAGLFDIRGPHPRPTALTKLVSKLAKGESFTHPTLAEKGWWNRPCRVIYFGDSKEETMTTIPHEQDTRPLLIIGKAGTLAQAFSRVCKARAIHHVAIGRNDVNILDPQALERVIQQYNPWAVVNTAGYVRVDDAEEECDNCFDINTLAPEYMAAICHKLGIHFTTFSSDLVFDGKKNTPYLESDVVGPLNIYGQSKALAEEKVMKANPSALVIRTSAFFGPWDQYNFVYFVLNSLKNNQEMTVAKDLTISPTYVPDLVNTTLDLLIDEVSGIWNISNHAEVSWLELAEQVADRSGHKKNKLVGMPVSEMGWKAPRPAYTAMTTEKGFLLPSLDDALGRFMKEQETLVL
ncbi:family 1 glycosylhydrolase [Aridibaculum aurantiacum]|uniref:family 1 glycosylhydrolase n=1 Tax=Aridibaculum aurantiacum TaxID=2810307 RepID=UPI001A97B1E5|nr:family 1 glycosylhydrolase [Aridibaculum aurantiacum]